MNIFGLKQKHVLPACGLCVLVLWGGCLQAQRVAWAQNPAESGAKSCRASASFQPSREEIQQFFARQAGNAVHHAQWQARFYRCRIAWQGQVFRVENHPASQRVEVLVKVLPATLLYDTVVVLEGPLGQWQSPKRGQRVRFEGQVVNGTDWMGIKTVQVLLQRPEHLAVF
ncbi:MAG: hypothetical protein SFZ03_05715 [Candidatus Melainabacteria bacterium]|nr:hypothetical protein [Candidatus Melainabacteria bacterium]